MAIEQEKKTVDSVLLFDVNVIKLDECGEECENNENILCRHRLGFNARIHYCNGYINFVSFFDSQVILHFIYLIKFHKIAYSRSSKFVIVTKDKNFLQDAKMEWERKKKKGTQPKLDFGPGYVRTGDITITVHRLMFKNGVGGRDEQLLTIRQINAYFGRGG